MAKAKVLADRISVASEILTDANIRKVEILSPATLKLVDTNDNNTVLYEISEDICNSFTKYGATFHDGKTLATIGEDIMALDKDEREEAIKNILTAVLTKINAIESQVEEYLESANEVDIDLEFLD